MTDDLRELLDAEGIEHRPLSALEDTAWQLASWDGGNQYQARASLPGGRVIVCGVHGFSTDRARLDLAALFGTEAKHWTAVKVRRRGDRPQRYTSPPAAGWTAKPRGAR